MLWHRGADSLHIGAMLTATSTLLASDAPPPVVSAGLAALVRRLAQKQAMRRTAEALAAWLEDKNTKIAEQIRDGGERLVALRTIGC